MLFWYGRLGVRLFDYILELFNNIIELIGYKIDD